MKIEVLVATMHQKNYSLIEMMNISTDAIIGNQSNMNKIEEIQIDGNNVKWFSFKETGVGLNRNNVLMRSQADICILADDDIVYMDNYKDVVKKAFEKYEDADVIIFNIFENPVTRYVVKNKFRVRWYNFMRFGAVRIAFRRKSIIKKNIFFNLQFGGGCKYGSGEDTIFLHDCLKNNLKIVAVEDYILTLKSDRESTWFTGFNNKYYFDKGALIAHMYGSYAYIMCFLLLIKNKQYPLKHLLSNYKKMCSGIKHYLSNS